MADTYPPRWWETLEEDPWYTTAGKAVFGEREFSDLARIDPWAWSNLLLNLAFMGKGSRGLRGAIAEMPPPPPRGGPPVARGDPFSPPVIIQSRPPPELPPPPPAEYVGEPAGGWNWYSPRRHPFYAEESGLAQKPLPITEGAIPGNYPPDMPQWAREQMAAERLGMEPPPPTTEQPETWPHVNWPGPQIFPPRHIGSRAFDYQSWPEAPRTVPPPKKSPEQIIAEQFQGIQDDIAKITGSPPAKDEFYDPSYAQQLRALGLPPSQPPAKPPALPPPPGKTAGELQQDWFRWQNWPKYDPGDSNLPFEWPKPPVFPPEKLPPPPPGTDPSLSYLIPQMPIEPYPDWYRHLGEGQLYPDYFNRFIA